MLLQAALLAGSVQFVVLHGTNGQAFYVNPRQITTLREPVGSDLEHFPKGTRCVIVTTAGKYVAVQERCSIVRDIIERLTPLPP